MDVDDELLQQWEAKVQKFLQNTFVIGMDREDIAQELRIAIVKAANHFDETKGVLFHTYLHTSMVNTIRTLISKAQKNKAILEPYSIDGVDIDNTSQSFLPNAIANSLSDIEALEFINNVELKDIIERANLTSQELYFLELRLEGMTMEFISERLEDSAYRVRNNIQKKLMAFVHIESKHAQKKKN